MRPNEIRTKLEVIDAILTRIEAGQSENAACRAEGMPRSTFRQTALREQLGDRYAKALEGLATDQAHKIDELIEDMRKGKLDWQIGRIELDARKWLASKFLPKRYGDKTDITSDGKRIFAIPSELIEKHDIDTSSKPDSEG